MKTKLQVLQNDIATVARVQRLREQEFRQMGWDIRRNLAELSCVIHTGVIPDDPIPDDVTAQQIRFVHASEADISNVTLFGVTARQRRDARPGSKGNLRDHSNFHHLVCLADPESNNARFSSEGLTQAERLVKLNQPAIRQMHVSLVSSLLSLPTAKEGN